MLEECFSRFLRHSDDNTVSGRDETHLILEILTFANFVNFANFVVTRKIQFVRKNKFRRKLFHFVNPNFLLSQFVAGLQVCGPAHGQLVVQGVRDRVQQRHGKFIFCTRWVRLWKVVKFWISTNLVTFQRFVSSCNFAVFRNQNQTSPFQNIFLWWELFLHSLLFLLSLHRIQIPISFKNIFPSHFLFLFTGWYPVARAGWGRAMWPQGSATVVPGKTPQVQTMSRTSNKMSSTPNNLLTKLTNLTTIFFAKFWN